MPRAFLRLLEYLLGRDDPDDPHAVGRREWLEHKCDWKPHMVLWVNKYGTQIWYQEGSDPNTYSHPDNEWKRQ